MPSLNGLFTSSISTSNALKTSLFSVTLRYATSCVQSLQNRILFHVLLMCFH